MLKDWIVLKFKTDGTNFIVKDDPLTICSIDWFVTTFGTAFNNGFTFNALIPLVAQTGWGDIFNDWKVRNIIS